MVAVCALKFVLVQQKLAQEKSGLYLLVTISSRLFHELRQTYILMIHSIMSAPPRVVVAAKACKFDTN